MTRLLLALALLLAAPAAAQRPPAAPLPRVGLQTNLGVIVIEVDNRRAPITGNNFLRYVEHKRLDGTSFYRAARTEGAPKRGFIQGGVRKSVQRVFPPIPHEPTSRTGLSHDEGAVSMARSKPGTAMGDFFITANAIPSMDARGREPGFAVFGRVVGGMDVVRRILALPTAPNAGAGPLRGQLIAQPIRITKARRIR